MSLSGWGRFPQHETKVSMPRDVAGFAEHLDGTPMIVRGNGRAYGDSAIGRTKTLSTAHLRHMISFDPKTGQLVAEAGVLLADIISAFLPRGWFPMVTPGTKFVTLGGMIASDVHGKNHHKDGSMRACVDWVDVMTADGQVTRCSAQKAPELFDWTLGGMGLTGVILRAAIRLRPVQSGWIRQTTQALPNLDRAMEAFEAADEATYSVAWIDCLARGRDMGRSLLMLGEHAVPEELTDDAKRYPFETPAKRKLSVPFAPPFSPINGLSVRAFNGLYYWNGSRKTGVDYVDWDSYFYPLDAILNWNRIYGRKGFVQFQCALPLEASNAGLRALLEATSRAGVGSFLAVLKRFGPQESAVSFPMLGYTLALDFPANPITLRLMEKLDQITLDHGGRFYLAKDARMRAETLAQSDPRFGQFQQMRQAHGAAQTFQSKQSERLSL